MEKSSTLSPAKQALLEQRLHRGGKASRAPEIPIRAKRDSAPLSFAQRQMWVIDQMTPGNPAYNLPYGYRLRGALDRGALEEGLNEIIRRHEVLRTTFAVEDDEPLQHIHPHLEVSIKTTDLSDLRGAEREAELQALATAESVRPFDLSRLPLIRVSLFELGSDEHVLVFNLHHIVADGLSMALLLHELDAFYRAFTEGSDPRLPALAVQYADFAAWQRRALADESVCAAQIDFWRTRLSGALPVLDLPTDRPRPSLQSFRGSNVFFCVPPALVGELKDLGAREGCTLFMTLLAAFQVLLQRYSGADDVIIGTPLAARTPAEVEPLIGNFLNMSALRCDLSGDPSFIELLRRSRNTTLDAFSNGDLPFEALLRRLAFQRDPSRNAVFQALLQQLPAAAPRLGDLEIESFRFDLGFAQFDLSLHLYEEAGGYWGRFEYCTDLFETETVERLASSFEHLLRAVVGDPERRLSAIPLLSATERNRILREWNATDADYPDVLLHELFEAQVQRTPDSVALEFEGQELTYAQLDARANGLAHELSLRGVGADALVGVLAERSFEMVVALIAVLKAGGAYVPLDPSYPRARLGHMLEDARVRVVLAQAHLAGLVPSEAAPLLSLEASSAAAAQSRGPKHPTTPQNLAYVIFTSGSTGRPKGAMITHRAICNRLMWMQQQYELQSHDRVLQKTPFSFDVSVWEFFWPLMTGARLVIARPEGHKDSGYLTRVIRETAITTLHFVPSMLSVFLEERDVESCRSLRRVICSGEALPRELQERFCARLPTVELSNLYGPTEAAVDVTYWVCRPGDAGSTVPIGRPVANTRIYVLDEHLEPVPVGVPGELYIGGVQVGRGYVGRPDLTAARFLSDPFGETPGGRLYRTGDRVRYRADGAIEYLGRLDYQVKISGQRIELGEIEATLDRHAGVQQSVVMAQAEGREPRLVAYVVSRQAELSVRDLTEHVASTLPRCMVPRTFVFLEALPLTSSGKVDRKALPIPDDSARQPVGLAAPSTPTEALVMHAFREVLGRADFGVADNFFDLGGHSLRAARLMARLRRASGVDMPLRDLFEHPTAAGLAEAMDKLAWAATSAPPDAVAVGTRVEIEL